MGLTIPTFQCSHDEQIKSGLPLPRAGSESGEQIEAIDHMPKYVKVTNEAHSYINSTLTNIPS